MSPSTETRLDVTHVLLFGKVRSFPSFLRFYDTPECLEFTNSKLLFTSLSTSKVVDVLLFMYSQYVLTFGAFRSISIINCAELSSNKASFSCSSSSNHLSHAELFSVTSSRSQLFLTITCSFRHFTITRTLSFSAGKIIKFTVLFPTLQIW
jgi:hypothetical protein